MSEHRRWDCDELETMAAEHNALFHDWQKAVDELAAVKAERDIYHTNWEIERTRANAPQGVPSVEQLAETARNTWNELSATHSRLKWEDAPELDKQRFTAIATAIRNAVLAEIEAHAQKPLAAIANHIMVQNRLNAELDAARLERDAVDFMRAAPYTGPTRAEAEAKRDELKKYVKGFDRYFMFLDWLLPRLPESRAEVKGLPTAAELDRVWQETYGLPSFLAYATAMLDYLAPWLRDPVAWQLDVTVGELESVIERCIGWHKADPDDSGFEEIIITGFDEAGDAVLDLCRSRIRPQFECKECALYERQIGAIRSVCDTRNMPSIHAESPEVKCKECAKWEAECRQWRNANNELVRRADAARAALEGE